MSRVIIACQDGGRRSEIAAEMVTGMGYTAIATIEGGVEAYLKVSPLKEADLRPRVKRVQQEVGIKYGGTGVTSEQTPGALRRRGGAFPTPTIGAFTRACADARGCAPDRRQRVSGTPRLRLPLVLYASICWAKERSASAPVPRTKPSTSL